MGTPALGVSERDSRLGRPVVDSFCWQIKDRGSVVLLTRGHTAIPPRARSPEDRQPHH